ncbi:reverse transcriptase domain-containing protein [Tanacetum coccineum]|uniref:Reverse transcriptase domain-containing protein n=1 Tax=Tanacetum coccineum TaxID=301880 RepID=A0ABQ5HHY8_9ASTR
MAKGDIDNLTMEQYIALTRGNQAPDVVKPRIGGNVNFEIKSQFMRELREDTFSGNKNDDAHEHVEQVLDIVSLFYILGVSHDAVMLPLSKGTVHHQRLPSSLKKSATSSRKETRLYTKPRNGIMTFSINAPLMISIAIRRGAHLDKDCPLNEEVKSVEEAKYGEFGRPSPFSNGAKYYENAEINTRNQSASLKNLETQIERLTKEFHPKAANEINNSSFDHCKAVYADKKTPHDNGQHEVSFDNCTQIVQEKVASSKVLPCQLPPKEMNPGNFTLPCTIRSLKFYAMADLGASVNVIPKSMFEHLKLAQLKKTDMLVEMADMPKRTPIKIVENVLVKIDKFLFPSDFVVMDMLNIRSRYEEVEFDVSLTRLHMVASIEGGLDLVNPVIRLTLLNLRLAVSPSSPKVPTPVASLANSSLVASPVTVKHERATMTFGALWRPVLALESWAGHVDAQRAEMWQARYDDHWLIHDLLVQNTMMQHKLQELWDYVTTLERDGSCRGQ